MFTSTITIEGRLAEEPTALDNLTELVVLTNRRSRNEAGGWANTDTSRYIVKTFKRLATAAAELQKGDKIIVAGSIVTETWTTDDGTNRYKQVVMADAVGYSLELVTPETDTPTNGGAVIVDGVKVAEVSHHDLDHH